MLREGVQGLCFMLFNMLQNQLRKKTMVHRSGNQVIIHIQMNTEHLLAQTNESDHPNNEEDDCSMEG